MESNNKIKQILVLAAYPFPIGLAPTTRIITYSKGLIANGVDVKVINYSHVAYNDPLEDTPYGIINTVPYIYSHKRKGSKSPFKRRIWDNLNSWIKAIYKIREINKRNKVDYVFLSLDSVLSISIFVLPLYLMGIKLIFIGDEYPIPIREKLKSKIPRRKEIFYSIMSRMLTARILMTDNLKQFYNNIYPLPTFILPTIVDKSRFTKFKLNDKEREKSICYIGNMELTKDNVDNIIKAYALIKNKLPDYELKLYGPINSKNKSLISLAEKLGVKDSVKFMGSITNKEVPQILCSASLLVSSQPNTKRAQGGFPTKLGEYLLSGTPVLMTNSGEITKYVQDGQELWIVEPENPEEYANKIIYIFENYNKALSVAKQGKNYILNNCEAQNMTLKLIDFLTELK